MDPEGTDDPRNKIIKASALNVSTYKHKYKKVYRCGWVETEPLLTVTIQSKKGANGFRYVVYAPMDDHYQKTADT